MSLPAPESPESGLQTGRGREAAGLSLKAVGLLVLINALWSGSSVASKYALSDVGPFTLAVVRFLPAGLLLYGIEWGSGRRPQYPRRDWLPLFLLGSIGIGLTYAIYYFGVQRTTASDSSLMFACEPLLIALFAVVFLRERMHPRQWLGMFVGIYGIWLIVGQARGNAIAVIALTVECSTVVIGKRLAERYRGLSLSAAEMLIGAGFLLPAALWELSTHRTHVTMQGAISMLYLCLICSALCYGVWYRLLEKNQASAMGAFILVQPVLGPVWSWALRGEPLKRGSAIGGSLVVVGLVMTSIVRLRDGRNRRALNPEQRNAF